MSRTIQATVAFGAERVTFRSVLETLVRRDQFRAAPPPGSIDRSCSTFTSSLTRTGTASGTCPPSAFASASSRWSTSCSTRRQATARAFCSTARRSCSTTMSRVRPERVQALGESLRAGRLEAGPWYVLADELIPSGEALVRNLLTGRRTLERFGAVAPPVLYCSGLVRTSRVAAGDRRRLRPERRRAVARLRQPAISARRRGLVALADRRTRAALSPRAERVRARIEPSHRFDRGRASLVGDTRATGAALDDRRRALAARGRSPRSAGRPRGGAARARGVGRPRHGASKLAWRVSARARRARRTRDASARRG